MENFISQLHQRALDMATTHRKTESALIGILQTIDEHRAYLHFDARSLYDYCERILGLSEGTSYNLITVARRAKDVPALKAAVQAGTISISKARKIAPVLNKENQEAWIALAASKSSREIEREVAKVNPQAAQPERFQYTNGETIRAQLDLPASLMEKLRRIQDLESQRRGKHATLVEVLVVVADDYLDRKDPVAIAKRVIAKNDRRMASKFARDQKSETKRRDEPSSVSKSIIPTEQPAPSVSQRDGELVTGRVHGGASAIQSENHEPIPARSRHIVFARDKGQCTYEDSRGRCSAARWLHTHHVVSRAEGGSNDPENLTLLCEAHHRMVHANSRVHSPVAEYVAC